ncbi:MAG: methyltransferase domain-containing protein [Gammaproteobacteria bacterium]|jgi:demethylspheroidene O-methyltransferase|nr:methyltransferase domain-containing protein [Gammaproteobacteria bacterium]
MIGDRINLRSRWLALRNRLLANPRFQRWAVDFPLTRPLAQRRARALFDVTAGFVYSQILFACVQLGLLPFLAAGPRTRDELARHLGLDAAGTLRLLKAASTLGLVEPLPDGGYGLGAQGAALLGNPGIAAMVEHHAMLYADLADPIALLRGEGGPTRLGTYWSYAASAEPAGLEAGAVADYSRLMSASQSLVAGDILDAISLQGRHCLLDVGGGEGRFAASVAARWPHLRVQLFDLPAVAARAQERFEREGLGERAQAFGGNMLVDALPRGADLISLVRVVHDHDDESVRHLLAAVHAALPPGGTLLLAEPLAGTPGAEPMGEAYFGFYLLAMGSGRPRTPAELVVMLEQAGFVRVRQRRTRRPLLTGLITAEVG